MTERPIVLIHGYSDRGESFMNWAKALKAKGYEVASTHVATYQTLTNEVSIDDIAEGLDRALRIEIGLKENQEFDAVVHSTGMLVARSWLATYGRQNRRLKHLIGLAPATFGSPLAHRGRGRLASLFKGNRDVDSPDFLEAGDRVLDALELGSSFTWDLTDKDLFGPRPVYDHSDESPFVFTFCGNETYPGIYKFFGDLVNLDDAGTDGTVRWAGCSLDTLKVVLDLTRGQANAAERIRFEKPSAKLAPLVPIRGKNHGSILRQPSDDLVDLVDRALRVNTEAEFINWQAEAKASTREAFETMDQYQQFVIRVDDERGRPIPDWNLDIHVGAPPNAGRPIKVDVHPYGSDPSLRCFHVRFKDFEGVNVENLWLRLFLSSGSTLVGYSGYTDYPDDSQQNSVDRPGWWNAWLNISHLIKQGQNSFFYPFTTTLIQITLNREPLPLDQMAPNRVLKLRPL